MPIVLVLANIVQIALIIKHTSTRCLFIKVKPFIPTNHFCQTTYTESSKSRIGYKLAQENRSSQAIFV